MLKRTECKWAESSSSAFFFLSGAMASDVDKAKWTCRKLLLLQATVAVVLAVAIPPLRYCNVNVHEGNEVDRLYGKARGATILPLSEEDLVRLGRAYAYFNASSEWNGMFPYTRQQPLYRLDFIEKTYDLLSRADRD
jgi:hypothetical protein